MPFSSSARSDGATFEHWQKADKEIGDYAYARYNVKVDIDNHLRYTDEEYGVHLMVRALRFASFVFLSASILQAIASV